MLKGKPHYKLKVMKNVSAVAMSKHPETSKDELRPRETNNSVIHPRQGCDSFCGPKTSTTHFINLRPSSTIKSPLLARLMAVLLLTSLEEEDEVMLFFGE